MKSYLQYSLVLFFALALSACDSNSSNDNNNNNNNGGGSGKMTATIGGTAWSAASATATKITAFGITSLTVAGADASAEAMTVSFVGVLGPGTFDLNSNNLASMSYIAEAAPGAYISTSGSATITTLNDEKVKGTFSFEGTRFSDGATISVTNGTFDVGYGVSPF
ncbi:MAG: hypothetical protein BMS9Abin05_1641 [Rhodothermia bacterium]|nr:MAG: hypothetical protein BMS9Abin05_1641 [Rhodothermia bacterium]